MIYIYKINRMIQNCLGVGAFGSKISGFGFGSSMFAILTNNEIQIFNTVEETVEKAFVIHTSSGDELF